MAIKTTLRTEHYIEDTLKILKEFIESYMNSTTKFGIDIVFEKPVLDGNKEISKPMLFLNLLPGSFREVGLGRNISDTKKGQELAIEIFAYWIITDELGGNKRVAELAQKLVYTFLCYWKDLNKAGLRKAKVSSLAPFYKEKNMRFYGGRQLITFELLLSYTD